MKSAGNSVVIHVALGLFVTEQNDIKYIDSLFSSLKNKQNYGLLVLLQLELYKVSLLNL